MCALLRREQVATVSSSECAPLRYMRAHICLLAWLGSLENRVERHNAAGGDSGKATCWSNLIIFMAFLLYGLCITVWALMFKHFGGEGCVATSYSRPCLGRLARPIFADFLARLRWSKFCPACFRHTNCFVPYHVIALCVLRPRPTLPTQVQPRTGLPLDNDRHVSIGDSCEHIF